MSFCLCTGGTWTKAESLLRHVSAHSETSEIYEEGQRGQATSTKHFHNIVTLHTNLGLLFLTIEHLS